MDPFEDTLRRLREAFGSGLTRLAEFRVAQLEGLSRFLRENRQLLLDTLAQDLHKVAGGESRLGLPIPSQVRGHVLHSITVPC